ncbi:MAG: CoA-binding protein [Bdellovibrionales bacterium]
MKRAAVANFKYFTGIHNLADIATKKDKVCVLNILGNESRGVTPTSHVYSGGNVVFGTSPGRRGEVLETKIGPIPVYNNVREGLEAGHTFNVGVVYLPPAAVRDGVFELIRVNHDIEKIIILTEKVALHDAREIRAMAQTRGIDVFGGNSLGVADSWNHVRLGGALGGDKPEESLRKGSVAIYSNSGNFTTTIATYLKTAGWGTTTSISSGKDVYIHFGPAEFMYALGNDERSKAAVLYVEPGGYYEEKLDIPKPVVACVVGRWKSKLTRAVGHAGALAGGSDNAEAKEHWFMKHFGVTGIFTPEKPILSAKGAVVTDVSHVPAAMSAVMEMNGIKPDFALEGDLTLKPWFGSNAGLDLPEDLSIPLVTPLKPYDEQIAALSRQVGMIFPRQTMKDRSAFSFMDPKTQVTRVSGVSVLDASRQPLESNLCLALLREFNDENDNALFNLAFAACAYLPNDPATMMADIACKVGNAPNLVAAAACSAIGPQRVQAAMEAADVLIDLFAPSGLRNAAEVFDFSLTKLSPEQLNKLVGKGKCAKAQAMLAAYQARKAHSAFVDFVASLGDKVTADAVLAALTTTIAWDALMKKKISRVTARSFPWYVMLWGAIVASSVEAAQHKSDAFCGVAATELLAQWSATEIAYLALFGEKPAESALFAFRTMLGLIISNGPGTISAQGAKGAVSADGPETPERVQINKGMVGFLTHTGFAHGGNGFEGIQFLMDCFKAVKLDDPGKADPKLDLKAMAVAYAKSFKAEKAARKALGEKPRDIPGVNHPVFKGKEVNFDPREVFISEQFKARGDINVFHDFYHEVVKALFEAGASPNVFCVNIDAVIAAMLLKLMWKRYHSGTFSEDSLRAAAFTAFLFGRMIGCAGDIDDHINRGRNMDMRTETSQCGFVS